MKLFISYAHNEEDTKAALRLFRELKRFGLEPWIDSESIPAGGEWEIEINQAIRQCNYFIAVLSSNSVDRVGYIQKELREAISKLDEYPPGSIFIIPVRINTCYPRHPKLTTLQWVDMFPDWEMGLEKIKASIEIKNAIAFNDKKLLLLIRAAINKLDGVVTEQDLRGIYELDLSNRGLSDISGLEWFSSLRKLDISHNHIRDISPLVKLSEKIKQGIDAAHRPTFNLNFNPLNKKTIEQDVPTLRNNGILIEPIRIIAKQLEDTVHSKIQVDSGQEISTEDLLKITELQVYGGIRAHELQGIEYCVNLERFSGRYSSQYSYERYGREDSDVGNKGILTAIYHNLNLVEISIYLEDYYFGGSGPSQLGDIADLSPISNLPKLKVLRIHCQEIRDLSPLEHLTALEELDFNHNYIQSIDVLANLTKLKRVLMEHNEIEDLSPLEELKELYELNLSGNRKEIRDLSPLIKLIEKGSLRKVFIPNPGILYQLQVEGLEVYDWNHRGWDYAS